MANEKISQLPAGTPAQSTDQVPIARSGANYFLTVAQILASALGAVNFSALTTGANTTAAMTVGSGASLAPSGSGIVEANELTNGVVVSGTPSAGQVLTATSATAADWQNASLILPSTGLRLQFGVTAGLSVTFPVAFSAAPGCIVLGNTGGSANITNSSISSSGFSLAGGSALPCYWLAIGAA